MNSNKSWICLQSLKKTLNSWCNNKIEEEYILLGKWIAQPSNSITFMFPFHLVQKLTQQDKDRRCLERKNQRRQKQKACCCNNLACLSWLIPTPWWLALTILFSSPSTDNAKSSAAAAMTWIIAGGILQSKNHPLFCFLALLAIQPNY